MTRAAKLRTRVVLVLVGALGSSCSGGGGAGGPAVPSGPVVADAGVDADAAGAGAPPRDTAADPAPRDTGADAPRETAADPPASDGRAPAMPAPDGRVVGTDGPMAPAGVAVQVRLVPRQGITGLQRINFAVPLAPGQLMDAARVTLRLAGVELRAGRRALARHPDGSVRSVQLQADVAVAGETVIDVRLGTAPATPELPLVPVETTLDPADGSAGPRVWALLPASWLSSSGVAGPLVPETDVAGTPLDAWSRVCNYARHGIAAFLPEIAEPDVWLFDRGTVFYRGYARRGDATTLESAYRETALYRARLTPAADGATIGVPGKAADLKYYYAQNLALHYLLTGDDRFREGAEAVAARVATMWRDPGYAGGADFWTERHAGFALLAYVWAMVVSDDRAAAFRALADAAVTAYLRVQDTFPAGYADAQARCFAHHADAHGEGYGYFGCSPWMSAILADGLEAYAIERGGAEATRARAALVKLGRLVARSGREPATGRPYYWMGVGVASNEIDPGDEHWGESAYVVALAWHHGGRTDAALETAANALVAGLRTRGTAPHLRSFNWQCRSAVATPYYLGGRGR